MTTLFRQFFVLFAETRGPVGNSLSTRFSKTSQTIQLFLDSDRKGKLWLFFDKITMQVALDH
jgi:hypothetical protein